MRYPDDQGGLSSEAGRRPADRLADFDDRKRRRIREFREGLERVCRETVYPHVFGNSDREVGGVLIGTTEVLKKYPTVTHAIEAISADEQRATLTFTHESWAAVHRRLDELSAENDELEIVGWYHSHPDFGIFLSGHDMFIQREFFSGTHQVALVVDPIQSTEGVFVWDEGLVKPLYEEDISPLTSRPATAKKMSEVAPAPLSREFLYNRHSRQGVAMVVAFLCSLIIGMVFVNVAYLLA
jgi:proteasome lid subunit RPN8/RPN11